jgi:TonB family protein
MTVIELLARSSVVIGVGLLALWCTRRQPAAFRHWILALAIMLAALQPAIRFAIPGWVIPELALPREAMTNAVGADRIDQVTSEIRFEPMTSAAATGNGVEQIATIVMQVWIAGAVLGLGVLLLGIGWLQWQTARSVDAGVRWRDLCDTIARDLGLATPVRVVQTRSRTLLLTWGVRRHVILLPVGAAHWSDDRKRLVLVHELSHVRRRDWVTQVVAEAARALYWMNPLFWIACARLRIESERACDDVVLGSGIDGASYATHLVDLARSFRNRRWLPAPSIARPSTLERRVVAMLNPELNRGPVPRGRKLVAAAMVLLAALPIAAATRSAGAPSGVLRDPSGKVLPGATVRLSAIGSDVIHETQSDSTGTFRFGEIPDGDYMLSARLPGFLSARTRVRVNASMPALDMTVQVGTLKETVTVKNGDVHTPFVPRYVPKPGCGANAAGGNSTDVGGNLRPPAKLKHVVPRYRSEWASAGLTGNVLLQAVIGSDGKMREIEVVSPVNPELEEEAVNAVSQWEFSSTCLNGEAIDVRIFVTVAFAQ